MTTTIPLADVQLPAYKPGANSESVGCSPFACPGDLIASQGSLFEVHP